MQKFNKKSLSALENLCKIKLTDQEEIEFIEKLNQVLDYIELLKEIDTKDVIACNYILMDMQKNIFREDLAEEPLDKNIFLANAPKEISSMIEVPEILSKNTGEGNFDV